MLAALLLSFAPVTPSFDDDARAAIEMAAAARVRMKAVATAPAPRPKPPPARPDPVVRPTYPRGYHEHECPDCHIRWGGVSGDHGHNCPNPKCRRYVNEHADGPFRLPPPQPRPVRIVPRVSLPTSGPDCLT